MGDAPRLATVTGETPWWLCPNQPRCSHGSVLHDIIDHGDPLPTCCVEGCRCGHTHDDATPGRPQ